MIIIIKLTASQEKINSLSYMNNIKLFGQNEKEMETLIKAVRIFSQDIDMELGVEKGVVLIMRNWKRHIRKKKNNETKKDIRMF